MAVLALPFLHALFLAVSLVYHIVMTVILYYQSDSIRVYFEIIIISQGQGMGFLNRMMGGYQTVISHS